MDHREFWKLGSLIATLAFFCGGCLTGGAVDDAYRSRVAGGCKTADECTALAAEAESKIAECHARFVKFTDACDEQEKAKVEVTLRRREYDARALVEARQRLEARNKIAYEEHLAEARVREAAAAVAAATAKESKDKQEREACEADRHARMIEVDRYDAAAKRRDEMIDWEDEHCQQVDNAVDVVKTYMDQNGELRRFVRPDRGVDFVCNGKKPPQLVGMRARSIPLYKVPYAIIARNVACQRWDAEVGIGGD